MQYNPRRRFINNRIKLFFVGSRFIKAVIIKRKQLCVIIHMNKLGFFQNQVQLIISVEKVIVMGKIIVSKPAGQCKDRKSTRLNSSHSQISYAVFCLKKKKIKKTKNVLLKSINNFMKC